MITLVQRCLGEGESGLAPRPRRPRSSPRRTAGTVEDEIVQIRKDLDKHGHEAGAATIAFHLQARHGTTPAVSTIWRILTARGFVTAQPHRRPKSSYVRFAAEQPNERWQTDITLWTLAGGTDVEILHWLDDRSRLLLTSTAQRIFKGPDIDASYRAIATRHGEPASVLSDNGAIYTGRYRGQGRVALEVTLHDRGVVFTHSRPYHPQTCGKVQRVHQTVKKHLATLPPARTLAQLQRQLDAFRGYYNTVRPHRALHRQTPQQAYDARPKAAASGDPLIGGNFRVRHDTIDSDGKLTLRHNSRLHHLGIGRRHARKTVMILVHDLHIRIITPADSYSATSNSTPPGTTNHNRKRERCPETPVNGVPRHRKGAPRGT